ncbi:MAG: hypothetical protein HY775_12735 [Acidobacteria bacterium]|nr:hypothetical protein [Acidobacteriota bacterium]
MPVTRQELSALDRLVGMVKERKDKPFGGAGDFNAFERELAERLREVGREMLAEELRKADVDAEAVLIDGSEHRRVLRATETYMTTMGPVTVERSLYKDWSDSGARAVAAMEPRLGIIGGFWTEGAAKQALWVVAQMTPALSEELFRRVGNMEPSKSSLDRLPKELNGVWEDDRRAFEAELRKVTVVPEGTASIAVSLDGVLIPMRDGGAVETRERAADDGRTSKGPAGYREASCATISFCDDDGDLISAIRIARMPEYKKRTLKAALLAELQSVWEQCPDLPVVKLADAARDNWDYLDREVPVGDSLVDFFHATEHLHHALAAAYGDGARDTRLRFDELSEILRDDEGGIDRVVASLQYLRGKHPRSATIQRELKFFRRNRKRMRYWQFREKGLPIGSGVVEAACKTLVAQRLKQSGMRWGNDGGQAILTARGWSQSARFDQAWALLATTYQVQVTILDNVISIRRARKAR